MYKAFISYANAEIFNLPCDNRYILHLLFISNFSNNYVIDNRQIEDTK